MALTRSKLKAWLASPLDDLDLVVLQIDGLHVGDHLMVAAIGIDTGGAKHVLGLAEGATENAATVQAMLDNLIERGLDPERPRLYIVDGAKALSKAIRRTFGRAAALQRCQVHKGRNITDRLDESLHAGVRKVLRQAWQQDDAAKAERLLRNLARRLEHDAPGVSGSILEGLDEILTVIRLGLPPQLRHSLACTNAIENAIGTVRTVLGYVPLSQTGSELLFDVFSRRYENGATIVTSNLPFQEWTTVFASERLTGALLDRITHHVHILEMNGESYRLKQRRSRRRQPSE